MQPIKGFNFFIEALVVVAVLGSLSAVAIPYVSQSIGKGKAESYESEYRNIQTAVIGMLRDSSTGTLIKVGPTMDMSQVRTTDNPPLVLSDYLVGLDGALARSGCTYIFKVNGTVLQVRR